MRVGNIEKVVIGDIKMWKSGYWRVEVIGWKKVMMDGMRMVNEVKIGNGDGIEIDECKDVGIWKWLMECGDECMCVKKGGELEEYGRCEEVVVSKCRMR